MYTKGTVFPSRKPLHAFTLVELLVVISIIALLIALLIPALALAKAEADSVVCLARLRSLGQLNQEYAQSYADSLPYGVDDVPTSATHFYGTNDWDALLFAFKTGMQDTPAYEVGYFNGLQPQGEKGVGAHSQLVSEWNQMFTCPSALIPPPTGALAWGPIHYGANPNLFLPYQTYNSASSMALSPVTVRLSQVPNPSQIITFGDANQQTPQGGADFGVFSWEQNADAWNVLAHPYMNDLNYLVPPNGFLPYETCNTDYPQWINGEGLRYRHMSHGPNSGYANAVFLDGHAESIPINQNVSGTPASSPRANGTKGLRIVNIINPSLPGSLSQKY